MLRPIQVQTYQVHKLAHERFGCSSGKTETRSLTL